MAAPIRRLRCASASSYSLTLDNRCSLGTAPHGGAHPPPSLRFGLLLLADARQSVLARHGAAWRRPFAASAALRLAGDVLGGEAGPRQAEEHHDVHRLEGEAPPDVVPQDG